MHIVPVSKVAFEAGDIQLKNMDKSSLSNYDKIKEIAKTDEIDFTIRKGKETKYLPSTDMYTILAKREIKKEPFLVYGTGVSLTPKNATKEKVSQNIFKAVISAVEKLGEKITEATGKDPGFLKSLKK